LGKGSSGRYGGELSTILGQDATLTGNLEVHHSVRIDGNMKGDLRSTEVVTIGPSGVVDGNISAQDLVIGGRVRGAVVCQGKVTLEESSQLNGNLRTQRLVVEEGAVFNGMSEMGDDKFANRSHPPRVIKLDDDEGEAQR